MSNALSSQGFTFEIGNGDSPLTYTEVEEITSFSGLDGQSAEIDSTHLGSVAKEFFMGLPDYGSFALEVNHLPSATGQQAMRAARAATTIQDFKFTLSNGSTATFQGFVLSNPITGAVDSKIDGSFAIRITGAPTFA